MIRTLDEVRLTSDGQPDAVVALDVGDPAVVEPEWARYVAGVVAELRPAAGFTGVVRSDLPAGSGLSSSAALEVACALALGADASDPIGLARLCQAAEHAARGVPTGLLDQLASICGVEGSGLHLDCRSLEVVPVPLPPPDVAQWLVVWAGARSLAESGYADRVAELAAAEAVVGPLRDATVGDLDSIDDPIVRARARHVLVRERPRRRLRRGDRRWRPRRRRSVDVGEPRQPEWSVRLLDAADRRAVPDAVGDGRRVRGADDRRRLGWLRRRPHRSRRRRRRPTFDSAWYVRPSAGATVRLGA